MTESMQLKDEVAATPGTIRGALIVIEGLDRSGKSSQCVRLIETLRSMSIPTRYVRFPDRSTAVGGMISQYLQGTSQLNDHAIHLLFSANRWEAAEGIRRDISNGITVIVDRYSYSGVVYSAAKQNPALSLNWAWQPEVGLPRPDLCLFLGITPQEAAKRGGFGEERYETNAMQTRVRNLYQSLLAMPQNDDIRIVDAGRPMDIVTEDMIQLVLECIKNVESVGPLRSFDSFSFIPSGEEELPGLP